MNEKRLYQLQHAMDMVSLGFAACVLIENRYPEGHDDLAPYHLFAGELLDLRVSVITDPIIGDMYGGIPSWDGPALTDDDCEVAMREYQRIVTRFPEVRDAHYDTPDFRMGIQLASLQGAMASFTKAYDRPPLTLEELADFWGGLNAPGWLNAYTGDPMRLIDSQFQTAGDYRIATVDGALHITLYRQDPLSGISGIVVPREST